MKNKKLLFAALILCCSFVSSDGVEQEVMNAARNNLTSSLLKIPKGKENLYGFKNADEFSKCNIGIPYHIITLKNDFFSDEIIPEKNYLLPQNEWRVPVEVNGESRLLLTVVGQSGAFNVVDLGGMQLAKELQQKSKDFNSIDSRNILRIYPLSADFLVKTGSGSLTDARYIPLTSALNGIEGLSEKKKPDYSLSEVLQLIKKELKNLSNN